MSVMQDLYDSEINVTITWLWDGGIDVAIGNEICGIDAETNVDRWGQAEQWLTAKAIELYPHSMFARMYRDGKREFHARKEMEAEAETHRRAEA